MCIVVTLKITLPCQRSSMEDQTETVKLWFLEHGRAGKAHFIDLGGERTPAALVTKGSISSSPVSMEDGTTTIMVANVDDNEKSCVLSSILMLVQGRCLDWMAGYIRQLQCLRMPMVQRRWWWEPLLEKYTFCSSQMSQLATSRQVVQVSCPEDSVATLSRR